MRHRPLVILASHGFGDDSAANCRVHELARLIGEQRRDAEVVATFNLGTPQLADVLSTHADRRVFIIPLMSSAGYFAGVYLRQQISTANIDSANITVANPLGVGANCHRLIARRLNEAISAALLPSSETTILIVGHGTRRSSTSADAANAAASIVRDAITDADVRTAFLDQDPLLEDISDGPLRTNVLVFPFLIGGGDHARVDIPERLGVASRDPDAQGFRLRADGRRVHIMTPLGEDSDFQSILLDALDALLPRPVLRIGTRSSPLALWQTQQAIHALESSGVHTHIVRFVSEGDQNLSCPIDAFPTDGPFTDALEHALILNQIDIAVHSLKDLPRSPARGTTIAAVLARGSPAEALVSSNGLALHELPAGATVGTCSQRRTAQLKRLRPDLNVVPIRGTVEQRLEHVRNGRFDATVLAVAGLERLGLHHLITQRFTSDQMLPEAGQGAIALQTRSDDGLAVAVASATNHAPTNLAVSAERLFSRYLSEQSDLVAAAAATSESKLRMRARALSVDGSVCIDVSVTGPDPVSLAQHAVSLILAQAQHARVTAHAAAHGARTRGHVALVGAGPGDPGLMTIRGMQLLRLADVVIYDRLIDHSLLDEAPHHAERIDAGKSPGHHTLTQEQINALIIMHAQTGKRVVRLKGGDPYIFGRGYEEARECRAAGITCEVVSGVTSAIAGPAAAGIPVTARGIARTLAIVTPQAESGASPPPLDYEALSRIDTVVLLMARGMLAEIVEGFLNAGRSPRTPAAVVQDGTLPTQRQVTGTLENIVDLADDADVRAPAVVIIGASVGLQPFLINTSNGRLQGKRIVVTRPVSASPDLISALRAEGASVVNCPLIQIAYRTPESLSILHRPHAWTVFTSLHAVRGFWKLLQSLGLDARALATSRIAAVGPKTADELRAIGLTADLVPQVHRASALIDSLSALPGAHGQSVLFPCGTLARVELRAGLRARGMVVDELVVYETLAASPSPQILADIRKGPTVDAIMLYCPSGAQSAASTGLLSNHTPIACIGPTTANTVRDLGFTPSIIADVHTDDGLLDAMVEYFENQHAPQEATA